MEADQGLFKADQTAPLWMRPKTYGTARAKEDWEKQNHFHCFVFLMIQTWLLVGEVSL